MIRSSALAVAFLWSCAVPLAAQDRWERGPATDSALFSQGEAEGRAAAGRADVPDSWAFVGFGAGAAVGAGGMFLAEYGTGSAGPFIGLGGVALLIAEYDSRQPVVIPASVLPPDSLPQPFLEGWSRGYAKVLRDRKIERTRLAAIAGAVGTAIAAFILLPYLPAP